MTRRSWLLTLLTTTALIVLIGYNNREEIIAYTELESGNDYYFKQFETRMFDAKGNLSHILSGDLLKKASNEDSIQIETPHIRILNTDSNATWLISANNAQTDTKFIKASLEGETLLRAVGETSTALQTSRLDLDLKTKEASNTEPVTIKQETHWIEGVGLYANLTEQRFKLKSKVNGQYNMQENNRVDDSN